jgi:hypothetical protein
MGFDQEELAHEMTAIRMILQVSHEPLRNFGQDLGAISNLESNDPLVPGWREHDDVGEIAVQGDENGVDRFRLRDDGGVGRVRWKMVLENLHLVAGLPKSADHRGRDAMVCEQW